MAAECESVLSERQIALGMNIVIAIYLLNVYWRGIDSYVLIHDNLDSNISFFQIVRSIGFLNYLNPNTIIPNIMGGIPISSISHSINIGESLNFIFDSFTAYVINETISRLVAFWGMFLLLRCHVLPQASPLVICGTSLSFALLPFWPTGFLSVSGQPLVFYAIYNIIKKQETFKDWTIITLFPFYSSLILCGFAICFIMLLVFIYDYFSSSIFNKKFATAIFVFCSFYIISVYKLIYTIFFAKGFISHRSVWDVNGEFNFEFSVMFKNGLENFTAGQYHAASLHGKYILVAVVFATIIILYRGINWGYIAILAGCFLFSMVYGFWPLIQQSLPNLVVLKGFNWSRFHFLHPVLWGILFAISLDIISNFFKKKYIAFFFVSIFLFGQISYAYQHGDSYIESRSTRLTFRQFYSVDLFEKIKKYINLDQNKYKIVNIGFHPSIAQYNGFYTLDGYICNYDIKYKDQFRKVITNELEKKIDMKNYFDKWGSRAYIYSSELWKLEHYPLFPRVPKKGLSLKSLELDLVALKDLGCDYIFSQYMIENYNEGKLEFMKVFSDDSSPWEIYVYKII